MHRIVQHLTLLPALFSVAVCAQEPAVLPVRVPLPLAFSLVPPPPFLLDSRIAADTLTYETGTWQTPPSEPISNWGVSVGASNYDPWGVYGNHGYRSDCALGLGYPPWGCR
jgi:hypothetical protein